MRAACLLAVLLALPAAAGCLEPACPSGAALPGVLDVDLRFDGAADGRRDGALSAGEIQCAIDCLDGDPAPETELPVLREGPDAGRRAFTLVPAATLRFSPDLEHVVERPLRLPLAVAKGGRLHVEGRGAVLRAAEGLRAADWPRGFAILEKAAPPGANTCDVEVLAGNAGGWIVEGLVLRGPARGPVAATGLRLHGAVNLVVRDCRFEGLSTGLDLRFALVSRVEDCAFAGSAVADLVLGTSGDCPGGPCWAPCRGEGPALFPRSMGQGALPDSGSNATVVRRTRHEALAGQRAALIVANVQDALVEDVVFVGVSGAPRVLRTGYDARTCVLRRLVVEAQADARAAVVRDEGAGLLALDRLAVLRDAPGGTLVLDVGVPSRQRVLSCDDLSGWPAGWRVRYDGAPPRGNAHWVHAWSFHGPRAEEALEPLRWRGDAQGPAEAPIALAVTSPSRAAATRELSARAQLGAPGSAPPGSSSRDVYLEDGVLRVGGAP